MKTRNDVFEASCQRGFSFLANYGFALVDCIKDNYGCCITYKNNSAAITIQLEDAGVLINFFKLVNGDIPVYPVFFDPKEEFLVFDFNDLLIVRTGAKVEQDPKLMYNEEYMKGKITEFAELLRRHGDDVLSGDFGILPKIKERVVRRVKELEDEQ